MTIDEIIKRVNGIDRAHFNFFSVQQYGDYAKFFAIIKREADEDKVEVTRSSKESMEAAANEAWAAFSRIINQGYTPMELMPALLVHERPIDN